MSAPTFHFLDPLNQIHGAELDSLLGRFVLDRWHPTVQAYEPPDTSIIITPKFLSEDLEFGNAEMYITTISHLSAQAAARKALSARGARTQEGDVHLSSVEVMKRGVRHAPSAFNALMADEDVVSRVRRMMCTARTHQVWMITAVLYATDAHVKTNAMRSKEANVKVKVQLPVGAAAGATVGAPGVGPTALNVDVAGASVSQQKQSAAGIEADMTGRRVFAVQYWRCEDPKFFDRLRGEISLRGKGLQNVDTGYKGLGGSDYEDDESSDDDEKAPPLVLKDDWTIIVGSHNDTATAMAGSSPLRNPASPNRDRELPELAANGTGVTAVVLTMSGTSFSASAVAGTAALLQSVDATLKSWPEGCKAILLASAGPNISGDTWTEDLFQGLDQFDGSGALNSQIGVLIAQQRRGRNLAAFPRGWDVGSLKDTDFGVNPSTSQFSYKVKVPAATAVNLRKACTVKVALAWDAKFPSNITRMQSPAVAFYLTIYKSSGGRPVKYSGSYDNNYDIVEFTAMPGEEYKIHISHGASGTGTVWYGVAWNVASQVAICTV
ncbi:hypothetical protein V501_01010 [Pseudogymnoascus sp. VKM F-4519 (FW-2642)]|nr:hypothetical protein V501_01010 [Pseudogymnoascus sp. VKM F-4519 (FW-2642)]